MHIIDWIVIGLYTFGALSTVATVGKPRDPISPDVATFVVILTTAIIVALVWSHGVLS